MVEPPGFDPDQSSQHIDLVRDYIENITKNQFEWRTMVSSIVDLLNHQHDNHEYTEEFNVNLPEFASSLHVGQ